MKVVGLVSGGKDSCYNLVHCVAAGHEIVALAHLKPNNSRGDEMDSFMYQTVGSSAVEYIAKAMDLPFYTDTILGEGAVTGRDYTPTQGDEVEDLHRLLSRVTKETGAEGVSVGAILSDYQRVRVESVCLRLRLTPLAYLWRRDQVDLLREMIENGMESILIKVACLGLDSSHLGKTLGEMESKLLALKDKFGVNVCGEGGEYETFTLDSPLFKKRLSVINKTCVNHSTDAFAPVTYLHLDVQLVDKDVPATASQAELLRLHSVKDLSPRSQLGHLVSATSDDKVCPDPVVYRADSNGPNVVLNRLGEGWIEINDIPGNGSSARECTASAFKLLKEQLGKLNADLSCLARVNLYVDDMKNYADINAEYVTNFALNPPVRVCVAVGKENLNEGSMLSMSVRGWVGEGDRRCMHVQGISHWAPCNIGPYSQGVVAGSLLHVSGQIALIPGSMELITPKQLEPDLSFRHVTKVLDVMIPDTSEHNLVEPTCYVIDTDSSRLVQSYWRTIRPSLPLRVILVQGLPRSANFEWEIVCRTEQP